MPDYMASLVVFGVIITIFLSSWNSVLADQTSFKREDEMRMQAEQATTFLVTTEGYPDNWTSSTVQVPGFAEPDNLLQGRKLEEFRDIPYRNQSRLLKAPNFHIVVKNDTGVLELNGQDLEYGWRNYSEGETVVPVTRNVQVNLSGRMENARLKYISWE